MQAALLKHHRRRRWFAAAAIALTTAGIVLHASACQEQQVSQAYVVTIPPLAAILSEVAGTRMEVTTLLAAGASPHTYEPRPSDVVAAEQALCLFYAHESIDGWAAALPTGQKTAMLSLIPAELIRQMPAHHHEGEAHAEQETAADDGHFWTSPRTVKAMLPALIARLCELDPEGAEEYRANAERFKQELDALAADFAKKLKPFAGEQLVLFHPSFLYLMRDYGLKLAAVVEPAPGKEPTPRFMAELKALVEAREIKALFTEAQLAQEPAEVLAELTGLPLYELDPVGGVPGRQSYAELLRYNVDVLVKALGQGPSPAGG